MTAVQISETTQALRLAGRVASAMVDGDGACRIITGRALYHMKNPDPKFRFQSGDFYDVDQAEFLLLKKTLLRIQRFAEIPCATAFWLCVDGHQVTPVVLNGRAQRYLEFGRATPYEMPSEMATCCSDDAIVDAPADDDFISVIAPVKDSLRDVVGCVVLSAWHPESKQAPPAWS
jgi:hypothetical protein